MSKLISRNSKYSSGKSILDGESIAILKFQKEKERMKLIFLERVRRVSRSFIGIILLGLREEDRREMSQ